MKIFGIDLGTSNTYIFCLENMDAPILHEPEPVLLPEIGDKSGSIATVVMYEDGKAILAGNIAESEFYSNLAKRPDRKLASQFKPEIYQGEPKAMRYMTDFLTIIRKAMGNLLDEACQIFVGMPSGAREDFSINLSACFLEAGWPKPSFVRESDAALVSCLQSAVLDIDDLERKCLILDFGGGTCDFTTVQNLDVLQNGGDHLYGGRLFDDLFFQIFCRYNPDFAAQASDSPYSWYVHWIECKTQKEKFSDFMAQLKRADSEEDIKKTLSLHVIWFNAQGDRSDAYIHDYDEIQFIKDAENYIPTTQMLSILNPYRTRGGLNPEDRDLVEGRCVGLISWLQKLLADIPDKIAIIKVVITGGSSRWFFVKDIVEKVFPNAHCLASKRGYEDIAFGLALFPYLSQSRERVKKLLEEKLPSFTQKAINTAKKLLSRETEKLLAACSQRIVDRDIMPVLEEAQKKSTTIGELEKNFADNIKNDAGLLDLVQAQSKQLQDNIQKDLNYAFRQWLRENGVLLIPNFVFPVQTIGKEFFDNISVKIARLDNLDLMKFTLTTVIPVIAATTTAGALAHIGEPVMIALGGSLTFGSLWLLAKTAPGLLAGISLPKFMLSEKNREKIAAKNRDYIEQALKKSMDEIEKRMLGNIEEKLSAALEAMLGRLSVLNQVTVH